MRREDWLLLLLHAAEESSPSDAMVDRLRAQKGLFVVSKVLQPAEFYEFEPYHYGPFCGAIYEDAGALVDRGDLRSETRKGYPAYSLTRAGFARAQALIDAGAISGRARAYLRQVVEWMRPLDFNTLLRAIYQRWPEMRVNSRWTEPEK